MLLRLGEIHNNNNHTIESGFMFHVLLNKIIITIVIGSIIVVWYVRLSYTYPYALVHSFVISFGFNIKTEYGKSRI